MSQPTLPKPYEPTLQPKRTIEEALWEFIHHSPGVCTDCNERINEFSSSNDTVDAIIKSVGIKNIPPEAYEIVSRMIAQEFVVIVAASMLYDRECWGRPEEFIQEVWRSCGAKIKSRYRSK